MSEEPDLTVGVLCGQCDSPTVYFETCDTDGHDWAIASECQNCGVRYEVEPDCPDCNGRPKE